MAVPTTAELKQKWNELSTYYIQFSVGSSTKTLVSMLPFLKLEQCRYLVEAGCGPGNSIPHLRALMPASSPIYACDLSDAMIEYAQKQNYPGVQFTIEDCEHLSLPDTSCDRFLSNLCLQAVENPDRLLSEAYRVLEPNGIAGFSVWGKHSEFTLRKVMETALQDYVVSTNRSGFHLSDEGKLKEMIINAGFRKVFFFYENYPLPIVEVEELVSFFLKYPEYGNVVNTFEASQKAVALDTLRRILVSEVETNSHLLMFQYLNIIAYK